MIKMTNWQLVGLGDHYTPPECREPRLHGEIDKHPRLQVTEHDKIVTTGPIAMVAGRYVRTVSGSLYELVGEPMPQFLDWMAKEGYEYNARFPFVPFILDGRLGLDVEVVEQPEVLEPWGI